MIVYRLVTKQYASDLSGTGAAMYPGRWNKKGTSVLYTGESKEIALLETIVNTPPMLVPDLALLTLDIPDNSIIELELNSLPNNWTDYPAPVILSEIGQSWVDDGKSIALKVPSCVIWTAYNYILNCNHLDYKQVNLLNIKDFYFDNRLRKG